jgi:hypothetical protein
MPASPSIRFGVSPPPGTPHGRDRAHAINAMVPLPIALHACGEKLNHRYGVADRSCKGRRRRWIEQLENFSAAFAVHYASIPS